MSCFPEMTGGQRKGGSPFRMWDLTIKASFYIDVDDEEEEERWRGWEALAAVEQQSFRDARDSGENLIFPVAHMELVTYDPEASMYGSITEDSDIIGWDEDAVVGGLFGLEDEHGYTVGDYANGDPEGNLEKVGFDEEALFGIDTDQWAIITKFEAVPAWRGRKIAAPALAMALTLLAELGVKFAGLQAHPLNIREASNDSSHAIEYLETFYSSVGFHTHARSGSGGPFMWQPIGVPVLDKTAGRLTMDGHLTVKER